MNGFLKYLGLIIELIGVILLLLPKFIDAKSNPFLIAGGTCMVIGVIAYVVINKLLK